MQKCRKALLSTGRRLRVNPSAHARKDIRQVQNEMVAPGDVDKCFRLIRKFEESLGRAYRNDVVFLSVNHENRKMYVSDYEIRTELIKHQPAYRKNWVMRLADV